MTDIYKTIHTDSRLLGCRVTGNLGQSGDRWKSDEIVHINILELKTIQIGILACCKQKKHKHARIMSGNASAISYVNKKEVLRPHYFTKLPKRYGFGVTPENYEFQQHIY